LSDLIRLEQPNDTYMAFRPEFIEIPNILKLPIVEARKNEGVWGISPLSANHVSQSGVPGNNGNIIIYGHNTAAVFGKLQSVKRGDEISLRTANGIMHKYMVVNTQDVDVFQIDLLQPTLTETLTIYTCSGWFDSRRFVVRAVPRN
jgi:LPXTG-site transpeptidase (sortase) family protein